MTVLQLEPYLLFLVKVAVIAAGAWVQACVSSFMFENMKPSKIFGWWLPFLMKKFAMKNAFEAIPFAYMMLGGCIYCLNVWLCIISFVILQIFCPFERDLWLILWAIAYSCISNNYLIKQIKEWQ